MNRPTESDAAEIARDLSGKKPDSIRRFPMGIAHWVYDIRLPGGASMVVRLGMANQRNDFLGALHWSRTLRPLGVPLPELLAHGEYQGHPYLVLERLDGEDLGPAYGSLTSAERKSIAEEVSRVQRTVETLPEGPGYGFLRLPTDPGRQSWSEVIEASLARSSGRIEAAGLLSVDPIPRVAAQARQFQLYFSRVRPKPFLDDITTKNVLVYAGRLSGIVDVDWLCFGDSLWTVALTRAALLGSAADPEYTDHWCKLLDLSEEQHRVLRFYTALVCVDFMSEVGQRFNQDEPQVDLERLERLEEILNDQLSGAE